MWIDRIISPVLRRAARQFPVLILSGARQCGKTSLLRHLWPAADYVTFDVPLEAERAGLDPGSFLEGRGRPVILDEAQYVPELFRHLKVAVDRRKTPGRFLVTGSQDFLMMRGASESLAGRAAVLTLGNLSVEEAPASDPLSFLARGGFPELNQRPGLDPALWKSSYLATYLERDVRNLANVGSLRDFDRFLRVAAARSGQLLNLAEMARDTGVAVNTARAWLSILQASHQVFLLEPWHRNLTKRLVKSPKLYFQDTGMLCFLLGIGDARALQRSPFLGAIWETGVVSETRKALLNRGKAAPLWFWRTSDGHEVDLLVEREAGTFLALEAKASVIPRADDLRGCDAFAADQGESAILRAAVVCRTPAPVPLGPSPARQAFGLAHLAAWMEGRAAVR